jgi:hypothetical protein
LNLNIDIAGGRLGATGVGAKDPGAADGRFLLEVGGEKIECIRVHGGKVVKSKWNNEQGNVNHCDIFCIFRNNSIRAYARSGYYF